MNDQSITFVELNVPDKYNLTINYWICTEFVEIKEKSKTLQFPFPFHTKNSTILNNLSNSSSTVLTIGQLLNSTINYLGKQSLKFDFKLDECHLFKRDFCFLVQEDDFRNGLLDDYLSLYDIKLFAFSDQHLPKFSIYSKKSNFKMANLLLHQQKFINQYDTNLNCSDARISEIKCLQNCFTKLNYTEIYFDFNDQNRNVDLRTIFDASDDLSVSQSFALCLTECRYSVCEYESFNTITFDSKSVNSTENSNGSAKVEHLSLVAQTIANVSGTHHWLQLFGLITLFTCTSVVGTLPELVHVLFKTMKKEQLFKKYFIYFKFSIVLFSLIFLVYQSSNYIESYHDALYKPYSTINFNFSLEPNPFALIICVPIQYLISSDEKLNLSEFQILKTKKFNEIERLTNNAIDRIVDRMYVKYGSSKEPYSYEVSNKVMFWNSSKYIDENKMESSKFHRCFKVFINPEIPKYKSMNTIASLLIVFKSEHYEMFILDDRLNFSSDLKFKISAFKIGKWVRLKSIDSKEANCSDYLFKSYCSSRSNCLDRCINKHFLHKHSSITTQTIIDKDHFLDQFEFDTEIGLSKSAKGNSSSSLKLLENSFFNFEIDQSINQICETKFQKKDCGSIIYNKTFKKGMSINRLEPEIELFYEKVTEQDSRPTLMSSILLILNLEGILFSTNFSSLSISLFSILKSFFKLKWHSFYKYIIRFICTIGFCGHLFFILNEVIEEQLVSSSEFSRASQLELPNLIFCFKAFDDEQKFDPNFSKTGNYLNRQTEKLTFQTIFKKIEYFNGSDFINLFDENARQLSSTKQSLNDSDQFSDPRTDFAKSEVKLSHFFFNNLKCFQIDNQLIYLEHYFDFMSDFFTLNLYLNEQFKSDDFYFFARHKQTKQLIEIYRFNSMNAKYKIKLEIFELNVKDQFELLKNPQRLLVSFGILTENPINDASNYLKNMKNKFRTKYNLSTITIPLEENEFHLELNDAIFHQFYLQVQKPIDETHPSSTRSTRHIFNCYEQKFINRNDSDDSPDLSFGVNSSVRIVKQISESDYIKLIQNILNSLYLWFDLCILEFYKIFLHLACLLKFIYRLLIKFRNHIRPNFH